jgi:uncharacterized metal-binding protein
MTGQAPEEAPRRVAVVPCSGIGKSYGTVTREAAYLVVEDLCPETAAIVPLSLLVLDDEEARQAVRDAQVITIDGCKLACATVNVGQAGGQVAREFTVLDCYRHHKQLKPKGIAELNEAGQALARVLAEEVAREVAQLAGAKERSE